MRTIRAIFPAILLAGSFLVSGKTDAATCNRAATGECLNVDARDYTFSADSKSLILSYQYRSGGRTLSSIMTTKIDMETLSPGKLPGAAACSTYLSEPRVSPDGKRIAFVNRGSVKESDSMIVIVDAASGELRNIPAPSPFPAPNPSARVGKDPSVEPHPFFSADGKYLRFTSYWPRGSLIRTFDLDAFAYVDFFTGEPFAPENKEPGLFVPVRSIGPISYDPATKTLSFIGNGLNLPKDLLRTYADAAQRGRTNVDILRVLMSMNVENKGLRVSEANESFLEDLAAGQATLGIGALRFGSNGRAYFMKDPPKARGVKKPIFEYADGKTEIFTTPDAQPLIYDFATPPYIFAVSPNRQWVAYTYRTNMGPTDGTDVLVVENVETHETRMVDLSSEAFRNPTAPGRC